MISIGWWMRHFILLVLRSIAQRQSIDEPRCGHTVKYVIWFTSVIWFSWFVLYSNLLRIQTVVWNRWEVKYGFQRKYIKNWTVHDNYAKKSESMLSETVRIIRFRFALFYLRGLLKKITETDPSKQVESLTCFHEWRDKQMRWER